jgi:hypothetical protein
MFLLKKLFKLLLICALPVVLFLGWRAFLQWGPGIVNRGSAPPAMFAFHAKALLKPLESLEPPEVTLPVPAHLSNADAQLRLMKLRDEHNWLPSALALGEPTKQGLRLKAGAVVVEEAVSVGPLQLDKEGPRCDVQLRMRWVLPESLNEIYRVRDILDLKLPANLLPGQSRMVSCRFVQRKGLWELVSLDPELTGRSRIAAHPAGIMGWLF